MSLFRSGSEEAFRAIHDRYRQRMFAYTRQMLSGSAVDAEDAVQEIFVRAYSGLRASERELALRAWLYRIAHNRCIDELRRPQSVATEVIPATVPNNGGDPVVRMEQRDALHRLIADVQRLPDQQRSALLMRELAGMTYADVAGALGVSVPAVKSLLVRARVGLAQANEARDTACARIREDLIVAHDRGVRASGLARRHLRDCPHCRQFRSEVRGVSRQLAAFVPALGPIGVAAKLLGIGSAGGGGAAAGSGALAGGTAATATATAAAGGLAGTGAVAGFGAFAGGHVVTLLAAAVVTAGGAIELQHIAPPVASHARHHHAIQRSHAPAASPATSGGAVASQSAAGPTGATAASQTGSAGAPAAASGQAANPFATAVATPKAARHSGKAAAHQVLGLPLSETIDPDHWDYLYGISGGANGLTNPTGAAGSSTTPDPASTSSTAGGSGTSSTGTSSPTSATGTSSSTPAPGTTAPATTGSATPTSTSGTAPASTTGSSSTTGSTGSTSATGSTGSTSATGSTNQTSQTSQTSRSKTTVTPAASTGPINSTKLAAAGKHHGHGTIAVFTMTGN